MRLLAAAALALTLGFAAHANPALWGTWSAHLDGKPLIVEFGENANGKVNGQPMRWQTIGQTLLIEQSGQVQSYSWQVKGSRLLVAGGDLDGTVALSRGTKAAEAPKGKKGKAAAKPRTAQASGGQELVGKWCNMAQFTANRGGGSSRMECFELKADGTYTYAYEGGMSATTGAVASQAADAGRWRYDGRRLTAQSRSGKVSTYALEKRNHPKNQRDPMICLDGTCYVTYFSKPAW